jgi:hypothetical protein
VRMGDGAAAPMNEDNGEDEFRRSIDLDGD